MNNRLIAFFCISSVALISSILLMLPSFAYSEKASLENETISIESIITSPIYCNNDSIINYSKCLRDEVATWYSYNYSNIHHNLTEEQLKEQGGVCWQYADYYSSKAASMGYYTQNVIIRSSNHSRHEFSVISNEEGYCILDQKNKWCFEFWAVE